MIATSRYSRMTILRTKTELSTNGLRISPNSSTRSSRIATPPPRAMSRTGAAAKASARVGAPAYSWPRPGKISERKAAANGDRARGRAPSGSCIAGRIQAPTESSTAPHLRARPGADRSPLPPRSPRPNVPTGQLEARLRRAGARDPGPVARPPDVRPIARAERRRAEVELPRRADHRQQPDGRPSRLGPRLQGPLPALPRHARRGPALPERVRLPGPVGRGERRAGPRFHVQARHRILRHRRVRDAVQAKRPDLRRPHDGAVDPARDVDRLERPARAAPSQKTARRGPGRDRHHRGPERTGDRHR